MHQNPSASIFLATLPIELNYIILEHYVDQHLELTITEMAELEVGCADASQRFTLLHEAFPEMNTHLARSIRLILSEKFRIIESRRLSMRLEFNQVYQVQMDVTRIFAYDMAIERWKMARDELQTTLHLLDLVEAMMA